MKLESRWWSRPGLGLLVGAFAWSCGSERTEGEGGAGGNGGSGGEAPAIAWRACEDADSVGFSCADVELPLDWDASESGTISVRLRRIAATDPRGTVWMLEGGPGVSGTWFLGPAAEIAANHPELDVVVVDHRGTGASLPLECDEPTDPPSAACLEALGKEHASELAHIGTTASARDVAALTRWFGRGERQILYGRSYGTYWAHRVLSIDPKPYAAVLLDSPCSAKGCPAAQRDAEFDRVARRFLAMCDADATCAPHLPGGGVAFAQSVIASADAGACAGAASAGLDGNRLRLALARLTTSEEHRALVPAILARYARCSAADVTALERLAAYIDLFEATSATAPGLSLPTNYHVTRSEFWEPSFTEADAEAALAETIIAPGASLRWAKVFSTWPWAPVPVEASLHEWHIPDVPVLVLASGLDAGTPAHLISDLPGELSTTSHFITLPLALHVASASPSPSGVCARTLIDAFFDDPSAPLDVSCVAVAEAEERAALFEINPDSAMVVLGVASAYD